MGGLDLERKGGTQEGAITKKGMTTSIGAAMEEVIGDIQLYLNMQEMGMPNMVGLRKLYNSMVDLNNEERQAELNKLEDSCFYKQILKVVFDDNIDGIQQSEAFYEIVENFVANLSVIGERQKDIQEQLKQLTMAFNGGLTKEEKVDETNKEVA